MRKGSCVNEVSRGRQKSLLPRWRLISMGLCVASPPRTIHLGKVVHAVTGGPEKASRLLVEHLTLAVGALIAQTYGGLTPATRPRQCGLHPGRKKRAKDMIATTLVASLRSDRSRRNVACRSVTFPRTFRKSTSFAAYQWLLHRRVEAAKTLLTSPAYSRWRLVSAGEAWRRSLVR
jgi:AraC family transcriptional regulator